MADKSSKNDKKTINMFLYRTLMPVLIGLSKIIVGVRTDKSALKGVKGPYLIVGNHTSPIDFLYFTAGVYPKPINFVVAENMIYRKVYGAFIRSFGTIKKKQFTADFQCIKQIKKNIDAGTHVLLFPEGRVSIDGTTGYIAPSIGKLIKFLDCTVVAGVTHGGYTGGPKWGKPRRTKVTLKLAPVLTKEEIKNMSAADIAAKITNSLRFDDNRNLVEEHRKISRCNKRAETLEKLLYKCPRCGAEFKNVSKYRTFRCTACGNTVKYNTDGTLSPSGENDKCFEFVSEWYKFQRDEVKKEVENPDYSFEENVTLLLTDDKTHRFEEAGKGKIVLDKNGITYVGTKCGQEFSRTFGLKNHPTVAYKLAQNIEIAEDNEIFKFVFENGFHTAKFVLAVEELHKKYVENAK